MGLPTWLDPPGPSHAPVLYTVPRGGRAGGDLREVPLGGDWEQAPTGISANGDDVQRRCCVLALTGAASVNRSATFSVGRHEEPHRVARAQPMGREHAGAEEETYRCPERANPA